MIKLREGTIRELLGITEDEEEIEGLALEDNFWRDTYGSKDLYFFTDEVDAMNYIAVKFVLNGTDKYKLVPVYLELEHVEDTLATDLLLERVVNEQIVELLEDQENSLMSLFDYLRYENEGSGVIFTEEIIPVLFPFLHDAYYLADEDIFNLEIADIFALRGKLTVGYCNELVLRDVELINRFTSQVVKTYDSKHLGGTIELDEDDEEKYMMEAYLDSLSTADAIKIAKEIIEEELEG